MAELHLGAEGYSTDGTNGRVGIGTNAPSEALTVSDTSQLSIGNGKGNAGANEIQIKAPAALLIGPDSKTNGNEFLRFATDTRRNWIQSFEATSGNPQTSALTLATGMTRAVDIDTNGNVGLCGCSIQFGNGVGVIGIQNAGSIPQISPASGGILFVQNGALKYRGSSGTVTTIAIA
jgi:hypothetical protein